MAKTKEETKPRYIIFFMYPDADEIFKLDLAVDDFLEAQNYLNYSFSGNNGGIYDRQENRIIQLKES